MNIRTIGTVHCSVTDPDEMPYEGVPARVEVLPEFEAGLAGIGGGTHIIVVGWLDKANRDVLQVARTRLGSQQPRGVFGLRSSHRPNPLSITTCRLERVAGLNLYVERLDLIDGTPVVDIKRYSPSWDCVFSARSSRDLSFAEKADRRQILDGMMVEAYNFHGEQCVGLALGVRMMHHAMVEWRIAQKDPKLVLHMGDNGCVADALPALSGASLGNGRMKVPGGRTFRLSHDNKNVLAFHINELPPTFGVEDVLNADAEALFSIRADRYAEGSAPHGGRPAKQPPAEEKQQLLIEGVQRMAVNGALPCAVAHRLAEELGVSIPDVGWAADAAKVRITKCQLGCFK